MSQRLFIVSCRFHSFHSHWKKKIKKSPSTHIPLYRWPPGIEYPNDEDRREVEKKIYLTVPKIRERSAEVFQKTALVILHQHTTSDDFRNSTSLSTQPLATSSTLYFLSDFFFSQCAWNTETVSRFCTTLFSHHCLSFFLSFSYSSNI